MIFFISKPPVPLSALKTENKRKATFLRPYIIEALIERVGRVETYSPK